MADKKVKEVRKDKDYYARKQLEAIQYTTSQKTRQQIDKTFRKLMAKTPLEKPIYLNGNIMWGFTKNSAK